MRKSTGIFRKAHSAYESPGFRRYLFNTGWMFAEKGLRLIAGLFIGAYVARYLGPSQYGLLNYAVSIVAMFAVFAYLGLEVILIRELVRADQKRNVLLGTTFTLRFTAAIIIFLFLALFNELASPDATTKTLIYVVGLGTVIESFYVIDYFFQSKVLSKYVVWSQMVALSCVSIMRIVLVLNNAEVVWFAWMNVLDVLLVAIGLVISYTANQFSVFQWKFRWQTAKLLLKNSWPMLLSSLAVIIYMRIDQIMIKWLMGDEANGLYSVAVRLSELWNFIPLAICSSLFPAILGSKVQGEQFYLKRLQWLFDLMIVIAVGIAIPMTFISEWVVNILFGAAYSGAGNVLSLYIWSSVFLFIGVANGKWIISENLQVFRMITLIASCVMNVALNFVLIDAVGLNGAAIATLISYAFASYFGFLFTAKTRPIFYMMTRSFNPLLLMRKMKS